LLARRAHFRQELARKLSERGYQDEEVREALDRLEGQGLVRDADTAQQFVEARRRRAPVGAARLRADLVRRGAPAAAVAGALLDTNPEEESLRAAQSARRWLATHRGSGVEFRAKLARHLQRKGFAGEVIARTLRGGIAQGEETAASISVEDTGP
jgi:regulatory protein